MKIDFINLLKCPYCGSDFRPEAIYDKNEDGIINGSVRCDCGEFAIAAGILYVKPGSLNNYVLKLLADGDADKAIGLLLWKYSEELFRLANLPALGIIGQSMLSLAKSRAGSTYNRYLDKNLSFFNLLGNNESDIYLKNRFSTESFWSVYPFIPVMKEKNERILDLSCGSGHASFVISEYVRPEELVCADYSFRNLYQARKYFAGDAECICLDANYPLPFKDKIFSTAFNLDAFHYIRAHTLLAGEMERILTPQGILLLLHLHNALAGQNPELEGMPLSPSGWLKLFKQLPVKEFPEKSIVTDYIHNGRLDLSKEYSEAELNEDNAICLLETSDNNIFRVYEKADAEFLQRKNNLIINPVYEIETGSDNTVLRKNVPSRSFGREFKFTNNYLPDEHVMDKKLGRLIKGRVLDIKQTRIPEAEQAGIENLMKNFIVLDIPENYY